MNNHKPRFRLAVENGRWAIQRGSYAPNSRGWTWVPVSYHFKLSAALEYAIEHVLMEGYRPRGVEALHKHIEQSTVLVKRWVEDLSQDVKAELEI